MGLQTLFARLSGAFYRPGFNRYRTEGVREYGNIVYDNDFPKVCRLDVYRKTLHGKLPVLVYLHGGISVRLGRQHRRGFCRYIAATGCAVLNIDFETTPHRTFSDKIKQILAVFLWAANNSEKYGLDMDNIIVGGDGSGAFLATALCLTLTDKSYADSLGINGESFNIKGLACFCGVYDLNISVSKIYRQNNLVTAFMGKNQSGKGNSKVFKLTDYITPGFPPVFFSHSINDNVFPEQGNLLKKTLSYSRVPYWEFWAAEADLPHIWNMNLAQNEAKACNDDFGDFIKEVCGKGIMTTRFDI